MKSILVVLISTLMSNCSWAQTISTQLPFSQFKQEFEHFIDLGIDGVGFVGVEEAFWGKCIVTGADQKNTYLLSIKTQQGDFSLNMASNSRISKIEADDHSTIYQYENPDVWGNFYGIPYGEIRLTSEEDSVYRGVTLKNRNTTLTCSIEE